MRKTKSMTVVKQKPKGMVVLDTICLKSTSLCCKSGSNAMLSSFRFVGSTIINGPVEFNKGRCYIHINNEFPQQDTVLLG